MKQKVIKQTLSIVVELSLKEVLTDLAHKKRTTPSKLCASILEEYIQVKGMGKSFKDMENLPKPVYVETPEDVAKTEQINREVDELADMLPNLKPVL
jgi:hypothetical protein